MRILLAEDDATSARLMQRALTEMGHEVTIAADGLEAWGMLQDGDWGVVITDWVMPGLDGPGLCRRVRAAGGSYRYLILMTARGGREDRLDGLPAGADDFLAKPVDVDELAVRLEVGRRILDVQGELERKNARLSELATSDALTGVSNRRRFDEALEEHVSFSLRHGLPLSLVLLDVDRFKLYNDAFGHPAGDDLLRDLARVVKTAARDQDVVARYGGEEFAVVMPLTAAAAALAVAGRLRDVIAGTPWPLRQVTASFGVATLRDLVASPSELVEQADAALYRSKRRGRNTVTHYRDIGRQAAPRRAPGTVKREAPAAGVPPREVGAAASLLDASIEGWSRALRLHDPETHDHSHRVSEATIRLARTLGIPEGEIENVRRGALLHDVGKIGIPDQVLNKHGPLDDREWGLMRRHPQYAHDLLSPIDSLRGVLDIPYCHHERWDGTGYPRGLKGEEIPLAARVFAVVDVWDALRSDRPYRAAWPEERVLVHLSAAAGTHLDPRVVDSFLKDPPEWVAR